MKKVFIIIIAIFVLAILSFVLISLNLNPTITGETVTELEYSYTKAICNETNFCQDYEIVCKGNQTIEIKPITGATIQHSRNWKDSRTKEQIEKSCD